MKKKRSTDRGQDAVVYLLWECLDRVYTGEGDVADGWNRTDVKLVR